MTDGIYVMGDDAVAPWLAACLASIRRSSQLPVTIIPFGGDLRRVRRLAGRFDASIFEDQKLLADHDMMGHLFAPFYKPGNPMAIRMFRKYVAWHGEYERFLFLDADTVVTKDPQRLIDALDREPNAVMMVTDDDVDGSYRACDRSFDLRYEHGDPGNLGVFVSRKGAYDLLGQKDLVAQAQSDAEVFTAWSDQTVVNWMLDVTGARRARFGRLGPEFQQSAIVKTDAQVRDRLRDSTTVVLHWAGSAVGPGMPGAATWWRSFVASAAYDELCREGARACLHLLRRR